MSDQDEDSIDEVGPEEKPTGTKKKSKLRLIGKRCRRMWRRRPESSKKMAAEAASTSSLTSVGARERRSRLAEDALFYQDRLEVSHLHGHLGTDEAEGENRIKKRSVVRI